MGRYSGQGAALYLRVRGISPFVGIDKAISFISRNISFAHARIYKGYLTYLTYLGGLKSSFFMRFSRF